MKAIILNPKLVNILRAFIYMVLVLSLSNMLNAQDNPLRIEVIPPSPESASLGKYGDIPVSTYTGIPSIGIPLYRVQSKNLGLDVSLSYHASGIKVEEVASRVGIGWSLNAGGVITRAMRGLPDDGSGGRLTPGQLKVSEIDLLGSQELGEFRQKKFDGIVDAEPDIFYYNFGGKSGKFIFDEEGNVNIIPYADIDIQEIKDGDIIQAWIITDEIGNKYYFGKSADEIRQAVDFTETLSSCNGTIPDATQSNFFSTWHLLSIQDHNRTDQIDLYYESYLATQCMPTIETRYTIIASADGCTSTPDTNCNSQNTTNGNRLSRIEWLNGAMKVVYGDERLDLPGDHKIDAIQILNPDNSINRSFDFSFDYFYYGSSNMGSAGFCSGFGSNTPTRYRLKLMSVQEADGEGSVKPPYSFEYNETYQLPDRLSYQQDFWGYYNGKELNTTRVPTYVFHSGNIHLNVPGANRQFDADKIQAGILKKINYPTNGYSAFFYEPNVAISLDLPYVTEEKTSTLLNGNGVDTFYETDFVVSSITNPGVFGFTEINSVDCDLGDFDCGLRLTIRGVDDPSFSLTLDQSSAGFYLPNGRYKAQANIFEISDANKLFAFRVLWKEENPSTNKYAGGLRINKIIHHDGISQDNDVVKVFKYQNLNNTDKSSGRVTSFPVYEYITTIFEATTQSGAIIRCDKVTRSSVSKSQLGSSKGGHVGYGHVEVWEGLNGENGKTSYIYSTADDFLDFVDNSFPFPPPSERDWGRGLLLNQQVFSNTNGSFIKAKSVTNSYESKTPSGLNPNVFGVTVGAYGLANTGTIPTPPELTHKLYKIPSGLKLLIKSIDTTFDVHVANKYITTVSENFYDSDNHLQLTSQTNTDSEGRTVRTNFKYPLDYTVPGASVSEMINRNIINAPIEQTQWVGGKLVSGTATRYKIESGLVVPEKIHLIETTGGLTSISESTDGENFDSNFKKRADHLYNDKGNLIQFRKTDDVITSYVWGYNNTLPIVQAVGIDDTSLETSVANAINSLSAYSNGLADLEILLNDIQGLDSESKRSTWNDFNTTLQSGVGDAQITTFTYDPLIGLTSQTDPNGLTITYEYDEFNRLKLIRDHENNILQHYEYHYHNETTSGQGQ